MFIKLELWEEDNRENGSSVPFGACLDAWLDMKKLRVRYAPINFHSIMSFENIQIRTNGRPGTLENKEDTFPGVRLLLADGSIRVIFNDKDPSFEKGLQMATKSDDLVHDFGRSKYMIQFGQSV